MASYKHDVSVAVAWGFSARVALFVIVYLQLVVGLIYFALLGLILFSFTDIQTRITQTTAPRAYGAIFFAIAALYLFSMVPCRLTTRKDSVQPLPTPSRFHMPLRLLLGLGHSGSLVCEAFFAFVMAKTLTDYRVAWAYSFCLVLHGITIASLLSREGMSRPQLVVVGLVDSLFACGLSVGFPLCQVVLPLVHFLLFTNQSQGHDFNWYANYLTSVRLLFATSPLKAITAICPSIVVCSTLRGALDVARPGSMIHMQPITDQKPRPTRILRRLLLFNGLVCVGVSAATLHAVLRASPCPSHCRYETKPWFAQLP
ncbi:hypothetical protein SPRG_10174 [Saprolegnia parasitica CBS 223.65]|uniref:Uncharacterized protein n=1 Tax=Saprolegnia parasitica (strain CBS 223.65) TaxID=695850 RepID=A0A067CDM8_SAPPC|nr:hypothetical protein SPRG_10174 [Saprolegnia parasitica CBS 223.65]KDO24641.1 hypothetical protein SPRG_10174 [Saprolegnia parasitica CBS 223.65]|eukprot:XP_012204709.1 hypothetical protein SPRG_10174 [Saprolegnia parasitica CBS 223.65]